MHESIQIFAEDFKEVFKELYKSNETVSKVVDELLKISDKRGSSILSELTKIGLRFKGTTQNVGGAGYIDEADIFFIDICSKINTYFNYIDGCHKIEKFCRDPKHGYHLQLTSLELVEEILMRDNAKNILRETYEVFRAYIELMYLVRDIQEGYSN